MPIGLVGRKYGMTRIFTDAGVSIPVTVIFIDKNRITQVKTAANDGYNAIQITAGKQLSSRVNKPAAGHFAKSGAEAGRGLWEFKIEDNELESFKLGNDLPIDLFQTGQQVDVYGITKGKGFAGTIKRHHFRSQDATHGNSLAHRAPGSTGMNQSPGRVFKGKKMAGQLGNVQRTVQNQVIAHIDVERNLIFIKGVAPGPTGAYVVVKPSVKRKGE